MKNKIQDLRNHLFAQLEKMADCNKGELDTEIDRAASMVEIAQTIVDSAKVEVDFIKATNGKNSDFFNEKKQIEK